MNLERLNVKAKRYMGLSSILMIGFFMYFLAVQIQLLQGITFESPMLVFSFVSNMLLTLIVVVSNVNAIMMFRLIRKSETPFQMSIVKKLRIISGLLIAFEPVQFVLERIANSLSMYGTTYDKSGEVLVYSTKTYTSLGGMILILGGVVACVSIAFEHGVVLQTQADETL